MVVEFVLYSKEDCCLCDDVQQQLSRLFSTEDVFFRVVKVNNDPDLEQLYGARVPVLVHGTRVVSEGLLDTGNVVRYLQSTRS